MLNLYKIPYLDEENIYIIGSGEADARTKGDGGGIQLVGFSLEVKFWRWVVDGYKIHSMHLGSV